MLRLRPYKPGDADRIVSWITDEKTYYMWSVGKFGDYPITASDMNDYYKTYENDELFYMMTAIEDIASECSVCQCSEIVGHMIIRFVDGMDTVRFGFIIVDGSKRGNGLGKSMLELAKSYAFDILRAKRITLGVFEDNIRAYNCYKSAGFCRDETAALSRININGTDYGIIEMEMRKDK